MKALVKVGSGGDLGQVDVSGADTDRQLVGLWLESHASIHTRRNYARIAGRFLESIGKPLRLVSVADVQGFASNLRGASATRAQGVAAVKSLLSFAHKTGYCSFNVGSAVKAPKTKAKLAERILPEAAVQRMLALEPSPRNRTLLRLLYAAGARVSELCALCWRDLQPRDDGGQVTVFGKGGKTRTVLLPQTIWGDLQTLRADAKSDDPVFQSLRGGALTTSAVWRIVAAAARRAGIEGRVSPHWLRHAHASHALDRGAPAHLVQATLGHASLATTSRYTHARPTDGSAKYLAV